MRVFVAGATGVIGRRLVPMLVREGHHVTGMTRSSSHAEALRASAIEPVVCDVFDAAALERAVVEAKPDVLIHELTDLPKRLDPRKYKTQLAPTNRIRREGTRNLVAAARAAEVRRLLAQSIAFAYESSGEWVKDESAPLALESPPPVGDTVAALAALERTVLEFEGLVLRYGFLYGPGTVFAADGFYAELTRKRRLPVIGSGAGMTSFIHVDDAASATVAALTQGSSGVYNIVDDDPAPAREWVAAYAEAIGAPSPLHLPRWIGRVAAGSIAVEGMTAQRGASNAKARRELGWVPSHASWREGFKAQGA